MRAAKPQSQPELLLPPLKATASIVTLLAVFLLMVVLAAHLAAGGSWPIGGKPASAPAAATIAADASLERSAAYPYSDPATIGLY